MIRGLLARGALLAVLFSAACGQTPALEEEHLRRGDAALAEGRYAAALTAYNHARDLAPTDPGVQRGLMRARVHLVAESASRLASDALEDARYEAQLLLDTDKARAPVYLTALANVLYRQGDVEGAKRKLTQALEIDSGSVLAHTALGVISMSRKEGAAQAKVELEAALKTKPDHAPALVALGQIKLAEGDLVAAVDRFEAALRVADDFTARMALGSARVQQQKPEQAIEHFQRAVQLDPKSAEARSSLGQALLSANRADEAERALRTAVQLEPEPTTQIALGFALVREKKLDQARALFGRILVQDPGAAGALFGAGMASEELGHKEEALAYYQRLLSIPSAGRERQMLADIQRDAQSRVASLTATAPSASAGAAKAPPAPAKR